MADAFACSEQTAFAVSVFGTNHRPIGQHAGTGIRAARPKLARWTSKAAINLALEFATLATPFFLLVVATALEAFPLEALAVVITNHALGARDD